MQPILKWVGSKRLYKDEIEKYIKPFLPNDPESKVKYLEPFVGGGSIAFDLEWKNTYINDLNEELVNLYRCIRDNLSEVLGHVDFLQSKTTNAEDYYKIRTLDRIDNEKMLDSFRAARTIYLNKMCFNGLYRVNKKGQFNAPIGRTTTGDPPTLIKEDQIKDLSFFLQRVYIENMDYRDFVDRYASKGDVVYLDPPYDYALGEGFTSYQKDGWTTENTIELANFCNLMKDQRGCNFIVSNNDTPLIRDLFKVEDGWQIEEIETLRSINCKGDKRKTGREVIIHQSF